MFKLSQIGLRKKIANDPYYRFQTLQEIAIAVELGIRIDANQATVDEWLRLPGFSIHQARSLVELVTGGVQLMCMEDVAAAIGFPLQRLQPFESIISFAYYDRLSPLSPEKINPNLASEAELEMIPDFNADITLRLIQDRLDNGKYINIVDLQRRLKLDSALTSKLMHCLKF